MYIAPGSLASARKTQNHAVHQPKLASSPRAQIRTTGHTKAPYLCSVLALLDLSVAVQRLSLAVLPPLQRRPYDDLRVERRSLV